VVCDLDFLKTLPARERISGLGEMIKYALIYDPPFFRWLEAHWRELAQGETDALEEAVAKCARWKARAVSRDERDVLGIREVLNFGHTVGHALESATGYRHFRHGEAILLGMRVAVQLSQLRGHLGNKDATRIQALLRRIPAPAVPASVTPRRILALIRSDKKARAGKVRFVLLRGIGRTVLDRGPKPAEILRACQALHS
jgi:3-dehydroquinate synthase